MVRNHIDYPRMKPCICKRCDGKYIGGMASNYCEPCKKSKGVDSKKLKCEY